MKIVCTFLGRQNGSTWSAIMQNTWLPFSHLSPYKRYEIGDVGDKIHIFLNFLLSCFDLDHRQPVIFSSFSSMHDFYYMVWERSQSRMGMNRGTMRMRGYFTDWHIWNRQWFFSNHFQPTKYTSITWKFIYCPVTFLWLNWKLNGQKSLMDPAGPCPGVSSISINPWRLQV